MRSSSDPPELSLAEANGAIPGLVRDLPRLRRWRREIVRFDERARILELVCDTGVVDGNPDLRELRALRFRSRRGVERFESTVAAMEERGHHLIDLDHGVVHFPARRGTEPILLCWKEGEEEIRHWHSLEEGALGESDRRRSRGCGRRRG